jgi:hypothetical protein
MSLINDALKRASQSQQLQEDTVRISFRQASTPAFTPPPSSVSKPQPDPGSAQGSSSTPVTDSGPVRSPVLPLIVILLIAISAAFMWLAHSWRRPVPHVTRAAAVPPPLAVAAPKPSSPPATEHTVPVTAPARVPWPRLKIQGITYYNGKWQAIINGRTVYVGGRVNGIHVAAISRNNVLFIAPDGSHKKLALGE